MAKTKKENKAEEDKIQDSMEDSIGQKGKMDENEMKAKDAEKDKKSKAKSEAQEFKASSKKEQSAATKRLNELIDTKKYEASAFSDVFKIMEYKHIQKNMARQLDKSKAAKSMFLQKFNGYFLPLVGYKAEGEVTMETLLPADL